MKAISVLGSTGSIGTQTLQIAEEFPEQFRVVALTAGRNLDLLVQQIGIGQSNDFWSMPLDLLNQKVQVASRR